MYYPGGEQLHEPDAQAREVAADPEPDAVTWKSCTINIHIQEGVNLELVVTDRAIIEKIAGKPVRKSKVDPEKAEYRVSATMQLESDDGVKESIVLFYPLGHFKRIGTQDYRIADFLEMRKLLRSAHDRRQWELLLDEE
jgi:hypothetical protein